MVLGKKGRINCNEKDCYWFNEYLSLLQKELRNRMSYEVHFTDIALKNLKQYPRKDQNMILKKIGELVEDPFNKTNVKRLSNFDVAYRLRVGNYRVLFDQEDILRIIDVINILHRKTAYRGRS